MKKTEDLSEKKSSLIIHSLNDNYRTIPIRPSTIDLFNRCPRQYINNKFIDSVEKAFEFGKKIHSCVLSYLINKDPERVPNLCKVYGDDMYWYLYESNNFPELLTIEKRFSMDIECGDILFQLSGSTDGITTDMGLFDLKTSSTKRHEDRSKNTMQFKLYSYMFAKELGLDYVARTTGVLIKGQKPKRQTQKEFFNVLTIEEEIKNNLEDLAYYYTKNEREPIENKMCFTCGVKSDCPIHTKLFNFGSLQ